MIEMKCGLGDRLKDGDSVERNEKFLIDNALSKFNGCLCEARNSYSSITKGWTRISVRLLTYKDGRARNYYDCIDVGPSTLRRYSEGAVQV